MSEEISVMGVIAMYWEMPSSIRMRYAKEAARLIWGVGSHQEKKAQATDLSVKLLKVSGCL